MDTNETGREPTEPTGAELELVLDLYRAAKRLAGNKTLADVQAVIDAANEVPWSAMKRLSGQRPLPDTPAPDEQDATLVKLIDLLTRTANAVKGQPGEMKQHGWADLPELCAALTARVAELEAELADAKRMVCAVQPSDDHESLYCHDTVFRGVPMNWFDARDKMLSAPGKEPTSE